MNHDKQKAECFDALLSCFDAIDDEIEAGQLDPGLDSKRSDAKYALDAIKRIVSTGRRQIEKILLLTEKERTSKVTS